MTTEITTTAPVETPVTKAPRRKLIIAAVTAGAVLVAGAGVGIPLAMNAIEQQRIADRTQQAEDAREAIQDALAEFEAARGEFVDGTLTPLFVGEGEELPFIEEVGEYVTVAAGRTELLDGEAIDALTAAHANYVAATDSIFEAYTAATVTPEVVLPTAEEYIDEDSFAAAVERDAKTVKDVTAAAGQFAEVEYTFDIDGEATTIVITGAQEHFEGLIAELAGSAPARAEAFVGGVPLASQDARDAVVAGAKAFEEDSTVEHLSAYLASAAAAGEAHAAAEAAAQAQQGAGGGRKSTGGSYGGSPGGSTGGGGNPGGSTGGGGGGPAPIPPRGVISPSTSACVGSGGSASANWTSNLKPPADAVNIRVTFENPGVSWGIAWSCDLGF